MADDAVLKELAAIREELKLLRSLLHVVAGATTIGGVASLATAMATKEVKQETPGASKYFAATVERLASGLAVRSNETLREQLANLDIAHVIDEALKGVKES